MAAFPLVGVVWLSRTLFSLAKNVLLVHSVLPRKQYNCAIISDKLFSGLLRFPFPRGMTTILFPTSLSKLHQEIVCQGVYVRRP